jgi:hypothetical protein
MPSSDAAKIVVRRNTEEVQGTGRFDVFEEIFGRRFRGPHATAKHDARQSRRSEALHLHARGFPGLSCEDSLAAGGRRSRDDLQNLLRDARRALLGVAPTHRKIHCESVDVMRVRNGKITDHWGVGNLLSLMQREAQLEPNEGYRRFELALAHYARGDRPAWDYPYGYYGYDPYDYYGYGDYGYGGYGYYGGPGYGYYDGPAMDTAMAADQGICGVCGDGNKRARYGVWDSPSCLTQCSRSACRG